VPNPEFSERLTPSPGTVLALLLSSPMVLLAALPFDALLAFVLAVAVPTLLVGGAIWFAPRIELAEGQLRIGKMQIPLVALGKAEVFEGDDASYERGPGLSPGSQRLFRGDIKSVVKIQIVDEADPTEYVLFSTRRGRELVSALDANRSELGF
jgi:hypothetical protein